MGTGLIKKLTGMRSSVFEGLETGMRWRWLEGTSREGSGEFQSSRCGVGVHISGDKISRWVGGGHVEVEGWVYLSRELGGQGRPQGKMMIDCI